MKKIFQKVATVGLVGIGLFALTGCGKKANESNSKDKKVEISYAIWDPIQQDGMEKITKEFMKENPNINVKVQVIPWTEYWMKLEASANGEVLPDVFWMDSLESDRYMKSDILLDLSDSYKKEQGNYPQDILDVYSLKNKVYGIPKDVSTVGLWYNKELFDEKGMAYPDDTWDWNTFKEAAQKLTDDSKGVHGFAAPNDTEIAFYNAIFQNEGSVISDDKTKSEYSNKNTQEAMQWWLDFSLKDKSSAMSSTIAEDGVNALFESGKIAMTYGGDWSYAEFAANDYTKKNCDVAVLPKGKVRATVYNGVANVVSKTTKHQKEAVKLLEFLSSKKAMEIEGESGTAIPSYKGTQQTFVDATGKTFNTQVFIDMMDYGVMRPYGPNFNSAEGTATETFGPLFAGKGTVESVSKKVDEKVDTILNQ